MEYKGYTARVEFEPEAQVLFGEVEGLRDVVTFEATDVKQLEAAFQESIDDYLEMCAARGESPEKPYSGKFLLRLEPSLHREIAVAAAREGRSLNAFASEIFKSWLAGPVGAAHPDLSKARSLPGPNTQIVSESAVKVYETSNKPVPGSAESKMPDFWSDMRTAVSSTTTPASQTPSSATPQGRDASNASRNVRRNRRAA